MDEFMPADVRVRPHQGGGAYMQPSLPSRPHQSWGALHAALPALAPLSTKSSGWQEAKAQLQHGKRTKLSARYLYLDSTPTVWTSTYSCILTHVCCNAVPDLVCAYGNAWSSCLPTHVSACPAMPCLALIICMPAPPFAHSRVPGPHRPEQCQVCTC